jgi:hypothetical protein
MGLFIRRRRSIEAHDVEAPNEATGVMQTGSAGELCRLRKVPK